jgi:hypothetical protein
MKDDGGPAFPCVVTEYSEVRDVYEVTSEGGMSLRDWFAGKAMNSILGVLAEGIRPRDVPKMAADAYLVADAMLAAREK